MLQYSLRLPQLFILEKANPAMNKWTIYVANCAVDKLQSISLISISTLLLLTLSI